MTDICLILGMHRSGTSALANFAVEAGLGLPHGELLGPHAQDNPNGYFEPKAVVQLNNRILKALGVSWKDPGHIPPKAFHRKSVAAFREEIDDWLSRQTGASLLLKDPRLCRLMPLWRPALEKHAGSLVVLSLVRHWEAVWQSLARRADDPALAGASIESRHHAAALWLRYNLDAAQALLDVPAYLLSYEDFVSQPALRQDLLAHLGSEMPDLQLVSPELSLNRGRSRSGRASRPLDPSWRHGLDFLYTSLSSHTAFRGAHGDVSRLCQAFMFSVPERRQKPPRQLGPEADSRYGLFLEEGMGRWAPSPPSHSRRPRWLLPRRQRPVCFISDEYQSRSHQYRVHRPLEALRGNGVPAIWMDSQTAAASPRLINQARFCLVHRSEWSASLQQVRAHCRQSGVPFGVDMDDWVFDDSMVNEGWLRFLEAASDEAREEWRCKLHRYRETLEAADFLVATTPCLLEKMQAVVPGIPGYARVNGYSSAQLAVANAWRFNAWRPKDERPRLLYASGTASHDRDFAEVVAPVAEFLSQRPEWLLTILGPLSESVWDGLIDSERVESRPRVAHANLWAEYSRADINLAPLERSNPFCRAKSSIKWWEPALVGLPSLVSSPSPYADESRHDHSAWHCQGPDDWLLGLGTLADKPGKAAEMAAMARELIDPQYSDEALMQAFLQWFAKAVEGKPSF